MTDFIQAIIDSGQKVDALLISKNWLEFDTVEDYKLNLEIMKKEIMKKELASFYIHGMFEARFKMKLLEEIFKFIKKNKIKNKRIIDY